MAVPLGYYWRRAVGEGIRRAAAWGRVSAAIGPQDAPARRFAEFGEGSCLVFPQGTIMNEQAIRIGRSTIIGPYTSLTAGMAVGQELLSDRMVKIGDRCLIGRGSHIVGHWSIEIGDDIQTGPYVYITDQNHSYLDPDTPIGWQTPVEAAVRIGSGCWLGANVVVLPGSNIGDHVAVAAGAVVRGEIPDHCVVAGVPARIIRRYQPGEGWVAADPSRVSGR
jgi:acetyltransferase-like isoleucine patch superfamily enzyme